MARMDNRSLIGRGTSQIVVTLPNEHNISKDNDTVNLIIGENIIIFASIKLKIEEVKVEVQKLVDEI